MNAEELGALGGRIIEEGQQHVDAVRVRAYPLAQAPDAVSTASVQGGTIRSPAGVDAVRPTTVVTQSCASSSASLSSRTLLPAGTTSVQVKRAAIAKQRVQVFKPSTDVPPRSKMLRLWFPQR